MIPHTRKMLILEESEVLVAIERFIPTKITKTIQLTMDRPLEQMPY